MDYHSQRWKRIRKAVLRRDGYMCQVSIRYGRHVPANTVHHIFPAAEFPEYQWEPWNLISLSDEMHRSMHDKFTNELTAEGRRLLERTARMRGIKLE